MQAAWVHEGAQFRASRLHTRTISMYDSENASRVIELAGAKFVSCLPCVVLPVSVRSRAVGASPLVKGRKSLRFAFGARGIRALYDYPIKGWKIV